MLIFTDIYDLLNKIIENTEPIKISNINLLWWSFWIAFSSLIVGGIAALFSYLGYKFQKKSAQHLEVLLPGHMSFYEVVGALLNNILSIESCYFGEKKYDKYPIKIIFASAKLPEDLFCLEKYEKDSVCYDEAFKLKLSWQNYNSMLEQLVDYTINSKKPKEILTLAQFLIDLTKTEITLVQKFDFLLYKKGMIKERTATNEKNAQYLINRFLESVKMMSIIDIEDVDTRRNNLTKASKINYIRSTYLPLNFNIESYIESEQRNRLSDLGEEYSKFFSFDPKEMITSIKKGEYNTLGRYLMLPQGATLGNMDFSDFQSCYFNYIEPILLGYKRYEYSSFLK